MPVPSRVPGSLRAPGTPGQAKATVLFWTTFTDTPVDFQDSHLSWLSQLKPNVIGVTFPNRLGPRGWKVLKEPSKSCWNWISHIWPILLRSWGGGWPSQKDIKLRPCLMLRWDSPFKKWRVCNFGLYLYFDFIFTSNANFESRPPNVFCW